MRQVRVWHNYQGMPSQNQTVVAGDYAPDDERLFGLADYLVKNGHAEWIGADEPVAEAQPITDRSDEPTAPPTGKRKKA
jgi:hypothetical protein